MSNRKTKTVTAMACIDHEGNWAIGGYTDQTDDPLHDMNLIYDMAPGCRIYNVSVTLELPTLEEYHVRAASDYLEIYEEHEEVLKDLKNVGAEKLALLRRCLDAVESGDDAVQALLDIDAAKRAKRRHGSS